MQEGLEKDQWAVLLQRIHDKKCTPFLGAGAAAGTLPLGSEIAKQWAREHGYPLKDAEDLARVAQFLAVKLDPMTPKEKIGRLIAAAGEPNFADPDEPHAVLAKLPLPLYLTTNFDGFMRGALEASGKKPQKEFHRWNEGLQRAKPSSVFDSPEGYTPSENEPLVYHLHGHLDVVESLVLTEDDYFDFLVNVDRIGIPPLIQEALSATSLLFIGYRLADWNFRVLFRGFVELTQSSDRRLSVTVQLPPTKSPRLREQAKHYLSRYFDKKEIVVYWGSAQKFLSELREHWSEDDGG
jgi:hypothetical protein